MTSQSSPTLRSAVRLTAQVATLWFVIAIFNGCGTTTQRFATEQMLVSDAVDQAIHQIDFTHLADSKVFLDTTFLKPVRGMGFVNAEYIISSLRQQLTASRCLVQEKKEDADVIVEPRVGALGTDGHEVTYGLPQTTAVANAAAVFSSNAIPAVPEISFGRVDAQSGIAKIIVYAYERETKQPVWQSGVAKAESNSNSTWVLGAGPFQKGSIYEDVKFAGKTLKRPPVKPTYYPFREKPFARNEQVESETAPDRAAVEPVVDSTFNYHDEHVFTKPVPKVAASAEAQPQDTVKQASHEESTPE